MQAITVITKNKKWQYKMYTYTYLWRHNVYKNANFKKSIRQVFVSDFLRCFQSSKLYAVWVFKLFFQFGSPCLPNMVGTRKTWTPFFIIARYGPFIDKHYRKHSRWTWAGPTQLYGPKHVICSFVICTNWHNSRFMDY